MHSVKSDWTLHPEARALEQTLLFYGKGLVRDCSSPRFITSGIRGATGFLGCFGLIRMSFKRKETSEVQGNVIFSRPGKKGPWVFIDAKDHNRAMHSTTCIGSAEKIL